MSLPIINYYNCNFKKIENKTINLKKKYLRSNYNPLSFSCIDIINQKKI